LNTTDCYKINNRINNYIRELNDYKEDLHALEKVTTFQKDHEEDLGAFEKMKKHEWNKQIEDLMSAQKDIQELIEAAEYERTKIAFTDPKLVGVFIIEKKIKLNNELHGIKDDVDKFVQHK
jgi:hypothetical protein